MHHCALISKKILYSKPQISERIPFLFPIPESVPIPPIGTGGDTIPEGHTWRGRGGEEFLAGGV